MDNRNLIQFRKLIIEKDNQIAELNNQVLLLKEEIKKLKAKKPTTTTKRSAK